MMGAKRTASLVFCAVLLGGCGGDFADLDAYMAEVKARPVGAIEPIPTFKPYQSFTYSAQSMRAPFDIPLSAREAAVQVGKTVKPDLLRAREFLERFNIEGLRRRGFDAERISAIKAMHKLLYRDGLTLEQAMAGIALLAESHPAAQGDVQTMLTALALSKRGIVR